MKIESGFVLGAMMFGALAAGATQRATAQDQKLDLSTSKQLLAPAPGNPQRVNSLPTALAVSPDGKWVVSLNTGYGTAESSYMQSLAVLNTTTGEVKDFPDARTLLEAKQTFFEGLAFSAEGTKIYVSMASSSDPEGEAGKKADANARPPREGATKKVGNGIVVYSFSNGIVTPQAFLKVPLVKLATGKHSTFLSLGDDTFGIPFPAAIAVVPGEKSRLLIAENLSDSVALMDAETGAVEHIFDLSATMDVPTTYPLNVVVTKDGKRAFVSLWNASEVAELDLVHKTVSRRVTLMKPTSAIKPGTHPCAMLLDESAGLLYVALSNRDAVAAVSIGKPAMPSLTVRGYFDTRLPGQTYFGAEPMALAANADGSRLYAANMGSDAIAVLEPKKLHPMAKGMVEPAGFVPTELMPMALASSAGKLYIATGKGKGTGPNNMAPTPTEATKNMTLMKRAFTYAPTLIHGSLAAVDEAAIDGTLKASTDIVLESNRMKAAAETMQFANGTTSPIKHVIYILKENRTYDQVLGDLAKDGKPVGNGDPKLTMYGEKITPNQHKLVLQFGVLDNFYDSGDVSGEGHVWSSAAIGTDYLEKTWEMNYRGTQRTYDYEGMVADGYPLHQHIPDVNEPRSSYIWTNFAAHGKTIYHFGEYVASTFCRDAKDVGVKNLDPKLGATSGLMATCKNAYILPGGDMPAEWGGGKNLWPWAIPRVANNTATKPELVGHFAKETPDFNLRVPDQVRVQVFLAHLEQWKKDLAAGHDTMPNYIQLRLPDDHTGGTTPGGPTPEASVADNDLAIGRAVEAISHSGFWDNTAFFILEDDAQNGGDHVDSHRSLGIVISKYAPHAKSGEAAVVDSRFYSTVSMIRTMETLLGVPPMNNNDAFASLISTLFTGPGDQPAFTADMSNKENGLIYTANKKEAPGAAASAKMDFTHADRAPTDKLNLILWQDAMGSAPPPAMLLEKHARKKDADDQ